MRLARPIRNDWPIQLIQSNILELPGYRIVYIELERTMVVTPDAPPQVRKAFILLWASAAIGITQTTYETVALPVIETYALVALALMLAITGAYAVLVYLASRRRNWARYVLLVWTVGNLLAYVGFVYMGFGDLAPSAGDIVVYASMFIELLALYWLFTSPGKLWFRV